MHGSETGPDMLESQPICQLLLGHLASSAIEKFVSENENEKRADNLDWQVTSDLTPLLVESIFFLFSRSASC